MLKRMLKPMKFGNGVTLKNCAILKSESRDMGSFEHKK